MARWLTEEQVASHQARRAAIKAKQKVAGPEACAALHRLYSPERPDPMAKAPLAGEAHSKYRNRKTGGYASKKEANRAQELRLLEQAGDIRNLREQVPFELIPRQYVAGKMVERECRYVADFTYEEPTDLYDRQKLWALVVEDVKSEATRTPEYLIKRKLMRQVHGVAIRET